MAGWLNRAQLLGWRRAAFAALIVVVAFLHALATREIGERLARAEAHVSMPSRIAIAYVRTLEPAAPAAVAPPAAVRPPKPRAARAPRASDVPVAAASAPRADAPDEAASTPDSQLVAADAAVAAASQPDASVAAATDAAASASETLGEVADLPMAASDAAGDTTAAAAPFAVGASAPSAAAGFEWPEGTRVRYILTGNYRGAVEGHAEVEWIRQGSRYQVNVDLVVGPEFAPILSRRATSEGRLTEQGLAPDRYDETTRFLFRSPRSSSIRFWPESVVLVNNKRVERRPGTQDAASQFVQFTWLFGLRPELLRVGNVFEIPLALPRSLDLWHYDVDSERVLQTPFGPLDTFHLKPRRRATRKPGEIAVEMWLAPELRFLPVRIRFEQDDRTWVDLLIEKKPELS